MIHRLISKNTPYDHPMNTKFFYHKCITNQYFSKGKEGRWEE